MGWAQAAMGRDDPCPTLNEMVGEDHPVRLFDEILGRMDWSVWEGRYHGRLGQPPIHPRVMAGVILYGMTLRVRSSRALEHLTRTSVDFLWLTCGRSIDHATLCEFRTAFAEELRGLLVQVAELARAMGLVRLNAIGLDGTRIKANSSRQGTASAQALEQKLGVLRGEIDRLFAEAAEADRAHDDLFGAWSPTVLPPSLGRKKRRLKRLEQALAAAQAQDAKRQRRSDSPKTAACVPVADPESAVLPNKEGGYAPHYAPMAAVDGHRGFIVDASVHADAVESGTTVPTVDRIRAAFGQTPDVLVADTSHGTGPNLAALADRGMTAYVPVQNAVEASANPARRPDPTQPVAAADWDRLPRNPQTKKLDKSAFVYDESQDVYRCPMGRTLGYSHSFSQPRTEGTVTYRAYQCESCEGCPLRGACAPAREARTVCRDEYDGVRQAAQDRLKTAEGQAMYRRRRWICETPFAVIKQAMGVRQFLLRGLAKVSQEWLWTCTAFNVAKLVREVARLRAQFAALAD